MRTIHVHRRRHDPARVIDVTPLPWWHRLGRSAATVLLFVVGVPILWLLGTLLGLLSLGTVAAILLAGTVPVRRGDHSQRRTPQPRAPSTTDVTGPN